jgi:sugar lactone lactonase YvrE
MKARSRCFHNFIIACVWTLGTGGPAPLVAADSSVLYYVETLRHGEPTKFQAAGSPIHFEQPGGIAVDRFGNVYVAETDRDMGSGNVIRKVTRGGRVSSFAGVQGSLGSRDGPSDSALFSVPEGLAVDRLGQIYVADSHNNSVRQISDGMVTTLSNVFRNPLGVALDRNGNVHVADTENQVIRRIRFESDPEIIAGSFGSAGSSDGFRTAARFDNPSGLAFDQAGNLYVADSFNHTIRKITPDGVVSTLAGAARLAGSAGRCV